MPQDIVAVALMRILPRGMFRLNAVALVAQVFAQSKPSSADT